VGVSGPSVAYFVFPPVFTFLATWALWRLIRAWTPRNAWLCFLLGSVFLVWSAQYPLTSGSYFLARIWQGKVALVAWLIPTLYVYLTRWIGRRDALTAVLLLTAGFGSIGLTGSATFVIPLVVLAAVIPLAARLEWRALPVPLATAAIPFGIGVFVLSRFPLAESIGTGELPSQAWFYQQAVGSGIVGAVAAFGIWAAPWIARSGPPVRITSGLAVVVALLTIPGSIALFADVSGLGGTLRRLLWVVPFPALVGLLVAVPLVRRAGVLVPVGVVLAVGALVAVAGNPLWMVNGRNVLHYPPRLHVAQVERVRAILRHYDGDKPILADKTTMLGISILTADPKAVDARTHYLKHTRLSREEKAARIALTDFIMKPRPEPTAEVRRALAELDVGLICVPLGRQQFIPVIEGLGPYREAFTTKGVVCAERLPESS
jgi:MFS family permease